jgi:hypothetical protein
MQSLPGQNKGQGGHSIILAIARAVLFVAGFLLWAVASTFPMLDHVREGWDGSAYWQIGVPLVLTTQLAAAIFSGEQPAWAPLWVLSGHALAMVLIHPPGTDLGLLPFTIVFIAVPAYGALFIAAAIGRKLAVVFR